MKKLKLVDSQGNIDCLVVLFYLCSFMGAITSGFYSFIPLVVALAACGLQIYRDDVLHKQKSPTDEINEKLEAIDGELSAIRIGQSMRKFE